MGRHQYGDSRGIVSMHCRPTFLRNNMSREDSIILSLWIEFSIEASDSDSFRCMGKYWHGYNGALQSAEKYLKDKKLIDDDGVSI